MEAAIILPTAMLNPLFHMARADQNEQLLDLLLAIELYPDMPNPARDYLVFSFTIGLAYVGTLNLTRLSLLDGLSCEA